MRRFSIARTLQVALLGLTLALSAIAAFGVASLYDARQEYEDRLADGLELQAAAARLLAAGVVEEATLRTAAGAARTAQRLRARRAFEAALADTRERASRDPESLRLVVAAEERQRDVRRADAARGAVLAARSPITALAARQRERVAEARDRASDEQRTSIVAIAVSGGLALLAALVLVAALLARVRRPLDELVSASGRLAGGDLETRVEEGGPDELRELGRSFNAMAADLERARTRIEAERRRLDTTVRSLGDGLIIVGADGRVTSANPRAAQLVPGLRPGVTAEEIGLELPDLGVALRSEVVDDDREGPAIAFTAAHLEGGGDIVWTLRDVSERARLERLKSEFVATASHELRSPLTSIKGFVELLAAAPDLPERHREFVEIVHLSTNRLVDLVNDLLDVARIEAGRVEVHRRPTDFGEAVAEVVALMRPRFEDKRQMLTTQIEPGLPRALADPSRIRQVLTNLLTNAHLYTPEGGRISVAVCETPGALRLTVTDTGIGMTPEELDHVFDRFVRGRDHDAPGTGLGLSIVRSMVELHKGTIDVDSVPGEGTTFRITIPAAGDGGAGPAGRHALQGKRVLVLDDEPEVAQLIASRLEPFGVTTDVVNRGDEALRRLRTTHYDAVTIDILMPGMSGFEVLRAMRADEQLCHIPAVVVSVFSGREALSGEWVVSKPIDAEELADALGAAVLAGRVRVLVCSRADLYDHLGATLDELGIGHEWAGDAASASRLCRFHRFEVALVDAGAPDVEDIIAALSLRGRRLRRSVVVLSTGDEFPGMVRLDPDPVALEDAGSTVLGLLAVDPADGVGSP